MFPFQKKKCTQETIGIVTRKRWNGDVWFLTAEYRVHDKVYQRTEQLRYQKVKSYQVMNIPVGMRAKASLAHLENGDAVKIRYNPQNPKKAYLPENTGRLFT